MTEEREMTAHMTSVGAGVGQSLNYCPGSTLIIGFKAPMITLD